MHEKESTDPKYNFNTYVTMELNQEGSELPTSVLGLALRCSLNLPGSKSPDYSKRLHGNLSNIQYITGAWE